MTTTQPQIDESTREEIQIVESEYISCRDRAQRTRAELDALQRELQHLELTINRHECDRPDVAGILPKDPVVLAWHGGNEQLRVRQRELARLRDEVRARLREEERTEEMAEKRMWELKEVRLKRECRAALIEFRELEALWKAGQNALAVCEERCRTIRDKVVEIQTRLANEYLLDNEEAGLKRERDELTSKQTKAYAELRQAKRQDSAVRLQALQTARKVETARAAHRVAKARRTGDALAGWEGGISGVA